MMRTGPVYLSNLITYPLPVSTRHGPKGLPFWFLKICLHLVYHFFVELFVSRFVWLSPHSFRSQLSTSLQKLSMIRLG